MSELKKRGDLYTPILPPDIAAHLLAIRSKRKRDLELESLYRPFSIGAAPISINEDNLETGKRIPKALAKELASIDQRIDLPPIEIKLNKDGMKMRMLTILAIHPFVVDVNQRQSYFPITVGFSIHPDVGLTVDNFDAVLSDPRLDPRTWSKSDRRSFWKLLLTTFKDYQTKSWIAQPDEVRETTVEITAKINVTTHNADENALEDVTRNLLSAFHNNGNVIQADFRISSALAAQAKLDIEHLSDLLDRVLNANDANTKGKGLEELVSTLFSSIQGFSIKQRVRTQTEEFDLVILNESTESRWRNDGPLILVECKNWSTNCRKNDLVQFQAKLSNRRRKCRLGFLISWRGFSTCLRDEMLRTSQNDAVIALIDGEQVRRAVTDGTFLTILQEAWDKAVLT